MTKQKKVYKVGIYARLSKEDSRSGESVSIENQKLMLTKHVGEMNWELTEIYQDDGFSGTNQNRPAFQRMIADVKSGFINTILIKDLSRLGRNYLEIGNLTEIILPEYGCELISLNEKLDDMMVFRNWFNEQHSKSTSLKIRDGKRASAESGKFHGTYAPYGYIKDPQNRSRLVIDENTAPIIRKIFDMRAKGMGFKTIAMQLNADNIICPREYYYQCKGSKNPKRTQKIWRGNTIQDILKNEVYIGNLVSGKSGTVSYKNQLQIKKDENDWIRVENTHEPIINIKLWDRVRSLASRKYNPKRRNDGNINLFTGLLYCADCGFRLRGQAGRHTRKDGSEHRYTIYICSTYTSIGKNGGCTAHAIGEKPLSELIINHILKFSRLISYDEERIKRIIDAVLSAKKVDITSYQGSYMSELESHQANIEKIDVFIENLYIDKISGLIPDSLFKRQIQKYEKERIERAKTIKALEKRIKSIRTVTNNNDVWIDLINQHTQINNIDIEILLLLIDRIIVGEPLHVNGQRVCNITIVYNHAWNRNIYPNPI